LGVRRGGADLQEPFGRELFVKGAHDTTSA
jgi:hypothetical protein